MVAVADLDATVERLGELVGSIRQDQWQLPTPCTDWTVRDLLSHVVGGNWVFAAALGARSADRPISAAEVLNDDPVAAYREAGDALVAAFREPGALERIVTVPFGTVPGAVALHLRLTELLVHGWDLAHATGIDVSFPADLAQGELDFTRGALAGVPLSPSPFGPPQPITDDAPAIDQLAALLGRSVPTPGHSG